MDDIMDDPDFDKMNNLDKVDRLTQKVIELQEKLSQVYILINLNHSSGLNQFSTGLNQFSILNTYLYDAIDYMLIGHFYSYKDAFEKFMNIKNIEGDIKENTDEILKRYNWKIIKISH